MGEISNSGELSLLKKLDIVLIMNDRSWGNSKLVEKVRQTERKFDADGGNRFELKGSS